MLVKNLLAESLLVKLMDTRFSKPSKNVAVWKYFNATVRYYEMLRGELQNGCTEEYFAELLETTEIETDVPCLGLTAEDFDDDVCKFSLNEQLWLNANEIASIVRYCKKWK